MLNQNQTLPVHDCEQNAEEFTSTVDRPYHYVRSGLSNVYLVGVSYWICSMCEMQAANIPAMKELHAAIARILVEKNSRLSGSEVRFLRKRLGKRSVDFAQMISMTPQGLSALEGDDERQIAEERDKLIRIIYKLLSGDKKLRDDLSSEYDFEKWIMALELQGQRELITATWKRNHRWHIETQPLAA